MTVYRTLVVIPTLNGSNDLKRLFLSLSSQTYTFDVCVVDSSSIDGSVDVATDNGATVHVIPLNEFNHGASRQKMVDLNPKYDIYVFLTQDAYLDNEHAIGSIVSHFNDERVGAVCGRQLPHHDAAPLAQHARIFNYPSLSLVKTKDDAHKFGIKTPFISNSFAAYRRRALQEAGGFPNHVILAEDMYLAARMLLLGWKVAYAGDACVCHSHNYSVMDEFRRYFDTGVFHAREPWIREEFGQAGGEGLRYVVSELRFLGLRRLYLWPASVVRNAFKLMGYKLGLAEAKIPLFFKKRLSMHWRYWEGPYAQT